MNFKDITNNVIKNDQNKNNVDTISNNNNKRKCNEKDQKITKKYKEIDQFRELPIRNTEDIYNQPNLTKKKINEIKVENKKLNFEKFPETVLDNIFIFLKNPKDWKSISETCKKFHKIITKPFVLNQLFEKLQERNFKIVDKENEFYKIKWILNFAKKFPEYVTHLDFHGLTLKHDVNGTQVDFDQEELNQLFSSMPHLETLNLTHCKGHHGLWRLAAIKSIEESKKAEGKITILFSKANKLCEEQIIRVKDQCFFQGYYDFKREIYNQEQNTKIQNTLTKENAIHCRVIGKWEKREITGYCRKFFPIYPEEIMKEFFEGKRNMNQTNDNENNLLQSYPQTLITQYRNRENEFLEFEGECKNNKFDGHGTTYFLNGNRRYVGEFKNGKYEGIGAAFNENGEIIYKGSFLNGKFHGKGLLSHKDVIYKGNFKDGSLHGAATGFDKNKQKILEGNFENNALKGEGKHFHPNGNVKYEGNFLNHLYSGKGKKYYPDGKLLYEGKFSEGKYHGKGTLYLQNGNFYKAEFNEGNLNGFFFLNNSKNNKICEGIYKNGSLDGWARTFYPDGKPKVLADMVQGKPHGKVINYKENGEQEESRYENGIKIN